MDRNVYDRMNQLEANHWWFVSRRKIIATLIDRQLNGRPNARILEAGCGSGGNLAMLGDFGTVDAFEYDAAARAHASTKSGIPVEYGALPDNVPFEGGQYDLIGLFDVLEHIEADRGTLAALAARLDERGAILVTVPAFPFMWSRHDERHHHFRRYTRASLTKLAETAGLRVSYSSYFNFFLFPAALATRAVKRLTGSDTPDDTMPSGPVNAILTQIFGSERHLLRWMRLPIGLSLAAVLVKA